MNKIFLTAPLLAMSLSAHAQTRAVDPRGKKTESKGSAPDRRASLSTDPHNVKEDRRAVAS